MNILETTYSFDDLRQWGALALYPERQVRKWFGTKPRISIGDTLAVPTRPSILFWAVMRTELVDEALLHGMAVDLAEALLSRLRREQHYLDFRTERVLQKKRAWLAGDISLGELSVARGRAAQARIDVSEIDDRAVWTGAKAAVQASDANGRTAFTETYYTALEHDASLAHQRAILEGVRSTLRDAGDHWSIRDPLMFKEVR